MCGGGDEFRGEGAREFGVRVKRGRPFGGTELRGGAGTCSDRFLLIGDFYGHGPRIQG